MNTLKVKWTGIRPLLMHSSALVDHQNPIVRAIKTITTKGSKKITDADLERRDRLEWEGGLYWDEELGPVIPSDNIEKAIQLGGQKSRLGKDVAAACLCSEPVIALDYDGPRDLEKLYADGRFIFRKPVGVKGNRIMRIRPMFPTGWSITFQLEFDATVINGKAVMRSMIDAGSLIGLGDWRPKFGRFLVEEPK